MRLRVVPGDVVRIDADPVRRATRDAVVGALVLLGLVVAQRVWGGVPPYAFGIGVLLPLLQVGFRLWGDVILWVDPATRQVTRRFFGRLEQLGPPLGPEATVVVRNYGPVARAATAQREWVTGWGVELCGPEPVLVVNAQSEADAKLVADTIRGALDLPAQR